MGMTFEYAGEVAAKGIDLTALNVARDLNETMIGLDYPFRFHDSVYGKPTDNVLRNRSGKSSLRRPIAKAELVLAWAAHMLRLTRQPTKFTKNELTFINILGTMLNAFVKRYDLIINIKYHQPCLDQLAFIRLMEIVYVVCIDRSDKDINLYGSWYDQPDKFKHIEDFMDIRLTDNHEDIRSHLSRLPRMVCMHAPKKSIFYNPVKCLPGSPIALSTRAWLDAIEVMRKDYSFDVIVKETAKAAFVYESQFVVTPDMEPSMETPEWYTGTEVFELTETDDQDLFAEQTKVIEDKLMPIKKDLEEIINEDPAFIEQKPSIVFSVMLKSEGNQRPDLSFIQI